LSHGGSVTCYSERFLHFLREQKTKEKNRPLQPSSSYTFRIKRAQNENILLYPFFVLSFRRRRTKKKTCRLVCHPREGGNSFRLTGCHIEYGMTVVKAVFICVNPWRIG